MPHPPYSPDLAPSDYHLFRSPQKHFSRKTFDSNEAVKNELIQFFASNNQTLLRIQYNTCIDKKIYLKNLPALRAHSRRAPTARDLIVALRAPFLLDLAYI